MYKRQNNDEVGEPVQVEQENETEADKPEEEENIEGNEEATTTPLVVFERPGLVIEELPDKEEEKDNNKKVENETEIEKATATLDDLFSDDDFV